MRFKELNVTHPRIVLLHATSIAIRPIQEAFVAGWPEAEIVNLLDDGLTIDRMRETQLSDELIDRFVDFGRYGLRIGADGILVTCSAFGPAIERMADELPIPIVKPNASMFEAAIRHGPRIGMLATFNPSILTMEEEFRQLAQRINSKASLTTVLVDGAIEKLRENSVEAHNTLIAQSAHKLEGMDAVMLAHFSTSIAASAVRAEIKVPVLTAPDSAVACMRTLVDGLAGSPVERI